MKEQTFWVVKDEKGKLDCYLLSKTRSEATSESYKSWDFLKSLGYRAVKVKLVEVKAKKRRKKS